MSTGKKPLVLVILINFNGKETLPLKKSQPSLPGLKREDATKASCKLHCEDWHTMLHALAKVVEALNVKKEKQIWMNTLRLI